MVGLYSANGARGIAQDFAVQILVAELLGIAVPPQQDALDAKVLLVVLDKNSRNCRVPPREADPEQREESVAPDRQAGAVPERNLLEVQALPERRAGIGGAIGAGASAIGTA